MLDFLIPATVLGMVGPVVAKMAVEQARKAGSAIGDVYFWGAIGSIVGTFLCGFVLIYLAPTSTIVLLVAAALALLAAALMGEPVGLAVGIAGGALSWAWARSARWSACSAWGPSTWARTRSITSSLAGNVAGCRPGILGAGRADACPSRRRRGMAAADKSASRLPTLGRRRSLGRVWPTWPMLAFVASLVFMALEMVAGRLVQRHLGSSIYGWTSVIGVLLAGLSLRQLPGRQDRRLRQEREAGELAVPGGVDPHA